LRSRWGAGVAVKKGFATCGSEGVGDIKSGQDGATASLSILVGRRLSDYPPMRRRPRVARTPLFLHCTLSIRSEKPCIRSSGLCLSQPSFAFIFACIGRRVRYNLLCHSTVSSSIWKLEFTDDGVMAPLELSRPQLPFSDVLTIG
jgi:hypothetical protein